MNVLEANVEAVAATAHFPPYGAAGHAVME
jgi:hypothetical protein